MTIEEEHASALRKRVRVALSLGHADLADILTYCEGADPFTVAGVLQQERESARTTATPASRRSVSLATLELPAPDPARSQWWFSTAGLLYLYDLLLQRLDLFEHCARVFCLGTPSLAAALFERQQVVTVRDVDPHVVSLLSMHLPNADVERYDAADDLPDEVRASCSLAVVDPPWYDDAIVAFLRRSIDAIHDGGEVICTLPGRLTRPGVEKFRSSLVASLTSAGHEILAIERGAVKYQVPQFELCALRRLPEFRGIPWRTGDLLHFRKVGAKNLDPRPFSAPSSEAFARQPGHFRVFMRGTSSGVERIPARVLEKYSTNISTRAYEGEDPDIWTTDKMGIVVGNCQPARVLIDRWAKGFSRDEAVHELQQLGEEDTYAHHLATALDEHLGLWSKYASAAPFRTPRQIEEARSTEFSPYATCPTKREHEEEGDGFRATYSRDRDRVLWSSGLRRLSDKTQLFPTSYDDDLRRRLTHSVEVLQLATTIGASFGFDRDLIEAGALAHDIGHTPFGHAGEHALNALLVQVNNDLRGFNHYEHGVDVVRFLEGPYYVSQSLGFSGLNLTPEVCETILKHTYCHGGPAGSQEILRRSKHVDFIQPGYCHLEGQAVRAADKVSYFISDLEDGIRLGALQRSDLLQCRFFHRPPLDLSESPHVSLHEQFLQQRRWVLKILMEDIIQASSKRLARLGASSPSAVRSAGEYMIHHSGEMQADIEEVWVGPQTKRLHKDRRVVTANLHAARIVSTLVVACGVLPELIDHRFREEHQRLIDGPYLRYYNELAGKHLAIPAELLAHLPVSLLIGKHFEPGRSARIDTYDLVAAKDYVAALTDSRARGMYEQVVRGEVLVST